MILTPDQLFVLLKVEADGAHGLVGDQLIDLLSLVAEDLVEVTGDEFHLGVKGRQVLQETSLPKVAL